MIFRYPGGKSKLLKSLGVFLDPLIENCEVYTEPFVGGGSVALYVAAKNDDTDIFLNDLDQGISSFWKVVSGDDIGDLFRLMRKKPSVRLFEKLRNENPADEVDKAYKALFLNRCAFSGISTSGPIGGYDQTSEWKIGCRYNYSRLKKEIMEAHELLRDRTIVTNSDFREVMWNCGSYYVDAPYYVKGGSLYPVKMSHEDHMELSKMMRNMIKNLKGYVDGWVISYDLCAEIRKMYSWADIIPIDANYSINGIKKTWKKTKECVIVPK